MAFVLNDNVKEGATTTGVGPWTLGRTFAGYQTFGAGIGDGNTTWVGVKDFSGNWATVEGFYTASGNTFTPTGVISSSNGGLAVNFLTAPYLYCDLPASKIVGGSDKQVQFNDAGRMAGNSQMTFDKATGVMTISPGAPTTLGGWILNFNTLAAASLPVLPHQAALRLVATDNQPVAVYMQTWGANGNYPIINAYAAGGTAASPTKTIAGQELLRIAGRGYQQTSSAYTGSNAAISFQAGEDYTLTNQGSWIGFRTVPIGSAGSGNSTNPPTNGAITPAGGMVLGQAFFTPFSALYTTLNADPGPGYFQAQAGFKITGATINDTVALVGVGFTGTYSMKVCPTGFAPSADTTTAFQIFKTDGVTPAITVDTTSTTGTPAAKLGINTAGAPGGFLDIYAPTSGPFGIQLIVDNGSTNNVVLARYAGDAASLAITTRKFRGTRASPTAALAGDIIGSLLYSAIGGAATANRTLVQAQSVVDTVTASDDISGYWEIQTRNDGLTAPLVTAMRVRKTAAVVIGNAAFQATAGIDPGQGGLAVQGKFIMSGPISSIGGAPSITAGPGAGTAPTVTITGDTNAGRITITTGTLPTAANAVVTIGYPANFPTDSFAILTPGNALAAALSGTSMVYTIGSGANFIIQAGAVALVAATQYVWTYQVVGK